MKILAVGDKKKQINRIHTEGNVHILTRSSDWI